MGPPCRPAGSMERNKHITVFILNQSGCIQKYLSGQIFHRCWFIFVFVIIFLKEYFEVHTIVPFSVLSFNELLDFLATY